MKRAGPGVSLAARFYLSDVSGRATPPTRVLGSTVRTDTTRVPRRRSDRVFLSILLSLCLVSIRIYDQCAMAMRLPIPACTVAVQRACDAPQHICECERVGGGTGGDRPSLLLVSRQHSTAKQKLQKLTIAIGPRGRLSAHRVGADPARGPMTQTPVPFPSPSIDMSLKGIPRFRAVAGARGRRHVMTFRRRHLWARLKGAVHGGGETSLIKATAPRGASQRGCARRRSILEVPSAALRPTAA